MKPERIDELARGVEPAWLDAPLVPIAGGFQRSAPDLTPFIATAIRTAVREALDAAAGACERVAFTNPNTAHLGPELNATRCAAEVRKIRDEVAP